MLHCLPACPYPRAPRGLARALRAACIVLAAVCGLGGAQAQVVACGELKNGYGPFDYLSDKDKLPIVEHHHFTPEVEMLVKGSTSVALGGDLNYTLLAFPNHPRALQAMVRLGARLHTPQPPGAVYSIACYFERALRFRPHDTTARLLYANYLFHSQRKQEALGQMAVAAEAAADNPFTHYNMGLMYLENQLYDQAREHAHRAYDLGLTQTGLRDKLEQLGRWP
jgi:hypothetical protein